MKSLSPLPALALVAVVAAASLPTPAQVCVEPTPIDHVCTTEPLSPADCVDQLGPLGGPPLSPTDEGYIGIASPVVDPLLRLRDSDGLGARMYAVNPPDNSVRVWEADFVADIRVNSCRRTEEAQPPQSD
jgi:hypothetical protein